MTPRRQRVRWPRPAPTKSWSTSRAARPAAARRHSPISPRGSQTERPSPPGTETKIDVAPVRQGATRLRAQALRTSSDVSSHQLSVAGPKEALGRRRAVDLRVLEQVTIKAWDRLLFVECGDGWLVEEAWRRLGKGCVCGLSTSRPLVDLAVRLRGVPGGVEFKWWDGERFPFPNGSFDRVMSCVPSACYVEPVVVLREMARVLRPDGDASLLESDGATPEASEALDTTDVQRRLVEPGLGEVQRERPPPGVIHPRRWSPAAPARRDRSTGV